LAKCACDFCYCKVFVNKKGDWCEHCRSGIHVDEEGNKYNERGEPTAHEERGCENEEL